MPSIVLQKFGGIVPRTSARLIGIGQATAAFWTKLWSGELRPFSAPAQLDVPLQSGIIQTIYKLGDLWLAWNRDIDVVVGFTTLSAQGHIFLTDNTVPDPEVPIIQFPPKQTNINFLNQAASTTPPSDDALFRLGIDGPDSPNRPPHPDIQLHAAIGGIRPDAPAESTEDPSFRYYVYTYYTHFNEESVPSFPSNPIGVTPEQFVHLTGFVPVDVTADPTIKSIRIYRTSGGDYLFVKELFLLESYMDDPATQELFSEPVVDDLLDTELAEPLISQHFYPPPDDLKGLIGAANGSLAGFHRNSVMFSEPYQPGAWPPEYERIFDYPVIGLGTFGQTVVVCTSSYTYLVQGSHPSNYSIARIPDPYPCVSKKSIVSTENGVIYASNEGLIFIGKGAVTAGQVSNVYVLTRQLMTSEEWSRDYVPITIIGAMVEGRYFGFYTVPYPHTPFTKPQACFIYDFSGREEGLITGVIADENDKTDILVDIDEGATAVFSNPYETLHYVYHDPMGIGNKLYKWAAGAVYKRYTWRSKEFSYPYAVTFSVGKVMFNLTPGQLANPSEHPLTLRLLDIQQTDLGPIYKKLYERTITNDKPFRLPSISPRTDWFVEVEGVSWVQLVQLATSYQELNERKT